MGIIILYYFCNNKTDDTMANTRKYRVGCAGSGWGIWEIATGNKIAGFGQNRIAALEAWYDLEGWRKPSRWY